jgi:hypothetical protein
MYFSQVKKKYAKSETKNGISQGYLLRLRLFFNFFYVFVDHFVFQKSTSLNFFFTDFTTSEL